MVKILTLSFLGACLAAAALAQDASPHDLERVKAGSKPPDFTLPTHDGRTVSLSGLHGKNVVLVFYRGYW